jgi:hypothetical protein
VHVLSSLVEGDTPSTKSALAALAALSGVEGRRNLLIVLERSDLVSWKSLRNLDRVHVLSVDQLNTYDVLISDDVVFTSGSLEAFLSGAPTGRTATAVATESEAASLDAPADEVEATPAKKATAKKVTAKKAAKKAAEPADEADEAAEPTEEDAQ